MLRGNFHSRAIHLSAGLPSLLEAYQVQKGRTFQLPTGWSRRKAQSSEVPLLPTLNPPLGPEALSYLHQCPITLANSQEIN